MCSSECVETIFFISQFTPSTQTLLLVIATTLTKQSKLL
jgi:hypothetical protein